jgi:small subunit ribosomal protein S21
VLQKDTRKIKPCSIGKDVTKRMAKVELRSGESQESLLRRFRKEVTKSRVLSEVKKRRWFISSTEKRRIEARKARRRARRQERKNQGRSSYRR